jgi:hypothetical protein
MTKAQIESRVEGWNWNMNIFEIYDELRDGHTGEEQEQLLTFAYTYFNNDAMINELASHFAINLEKAKAPRCIEEAEQMGLA